MFGDQRLGELFATAAEPFNPRRAHRRKICWVGVGVLARDQIGRPELKSAVVLAEIRHHDTGKPTLSLEIKKTLGSRVLRAIVNGGEGAVEARDHFAAFNEGMAAQSRMNEPKLDEAAVTMNRNQLEDVAWLADTGLRVWIGPGEQPFRYGERLDGEKAEALANALETFERRVVPNLLGEPEDERERRFTTAENRMHRVWRAYGKL